MSDPLGLSIGTTNLVAARVGNQPEIRRSVLTLSADRTPQVGVPESGGGVTLTGFVERVGDPVPLVAPDGASYPADTLLVEALDAMVEVVGGPSPKLAIAVPAHWGPTTLRALRHALRTNPSLSRDGMPARLVPDAVASLTALRVNPGLPAGGVVALLDFGGGGTSITLADAASGFEPIDETTRFPDFCGDQIDQALLTHVLDGIAQAGAIDPAGTAAVGSLARLREDCRSAKERLSALTATDLPVDLPGYSATVRVTRDELESLMQRPFVGVLDALDNALERNGFGWSAVSAVVTIGGGAGIPLITRRLSEHSRAILVTTPQPALDAAVGAALVASGVTASGVADAEAMTGAAPTLGVAAASDAATASAPAAGAAPDPAASSTFRALAWSEDEPADDVVPYSGPDVVNPYAANPYANPYADDTSARPSVQYVPSTGAIEPSESGWKRLPLTVFGIAVASVLVAVGGVTYVLTGSTSSTPTTEVRTAEPKPLRPQPEPSAVAPLPPPPETEAPPPPPPPVTVTEAPPPPPPVTETHVVTQTTTPPPTTTTTTTQPTTTTPTTTTTTTPTTTPTTTTNPMTTTYITVPFVPVPIPIQVPSREQPQPQYPPQYPQNPQYPPQNPQYPQNPFQPYP